MGKAEVSSGQPRLLRELDRKDIHQCLLGLFYIFKAFFQCLVLEKYVKMQDEKIEQKMCAVTTL